MINFKFDETKVIVTINKLISKFTRNMIKQCRTQKTTTTTKDKDISIKK